MEKEVFKNIAKEVEPLLIKISDILHEHAVDDTAVIYVNSKGYFNFHININGWELCRSDKNSVSEMMITMREAL